MGRPLAPRSEASYQRFLTRAFGSADPPSFNSIDPSVGNWPESCRSTLRAAIKQRCVARGLHTEPRCAHCSPARDALPKSWTPRRQVAIPGEEDARAYEAAAASLPRGKRALAILPLALGLRAEELCSITRDSVKRAIRIGELITMRKGGAEKTLPAQGVRSLLEELLATPAAHGRSHRRISAPKADRAWQHVGEILSPGKYITQYHLLHALVRQTGAAAGLSGLRPHLLRHAFATRMNRDGAPTRTIQAALNHARITTTEKYIHPDVQDVAKHQRDFNGSSHP